MMAFVAYSFVAHVGKALFAGWPFGGSLGLGEPRRYGRQQLFRWWRWALSSVTGVAAR